MDGLVVENGNFLEWIKRGEFVVSIQVDPPRDLKEEDSLGLFISKLVELGVKTIDINSNRVILADCDKEDVLTPNTTKVRIPLDSVHLGRTIKRAWRELDIIPHLTLRESSVSGLLSHMRSGYSPDEIRNFLIVRGDENEVGYAAKLGPGVFQTEVAHALKIFHMHMRSDFALKLPIFFGAAVNQNNDLRDEEKRLREKDIAGADFFMSQPALNIEQLNRLLSFYSNCTKKPLLVGIWPMVEYKTLERIKAGKVKGVVLPRGVEYDAYMGIETDSDLERWGIAQALKLINAAKSSGIAQGVYIVTPYQKPHVIFEIVKLLSASL